MTGLARFVLWLWVISIVAQLGVFGFLMSRRHFRRLPYFTTYMALNLCQAYYLLAVYFHFGFGRGKVSSLAWVSQASTLVLSALATTEILRLVLSPFRGIWALAWRLLAATSAIVVAYAAIHTWGDMNWAVLEADRGYHLTIAILIVACLLLVHHYSIPIHPIYKALLGGFCFYSCMVVLVNTILQAILFRRFPQFEPIWQTATLLSFVGVLLVWAVALRKPFPASDERPVVLSASVYQQISPEINARLRLLNEQLGQFWKLEAPRN